MQEQMTIKEADFESALCGDLKAFEKIFFKEPDKISKFTAQSMLERAHAALQEDPQNNAALTIIGFALSCYVIGHETQDDKASSQYLEKAADMGNPWAMVGLANLHRLGRAGLFSKETAATLYLNALKILVDNKFIILAFEKIAIHELSSNLQLVYAWTTKNVNIFLRLNRYSASWRGESIIMVSEVASESLSLAMKDELILLIMSISKSEILQFYESVHWSIIASSYTRIAERKLMGTDASDAVMLEDYLDEGEYFAALEKKALAREAEMALGVEMLTYANDLLEQMKSVKVVDNERVSQLHDLIQSTNLRCTARHVDLDDSTQVAETVEMLVADEVLGAEKFYLLAELILKLDTSTYFINSKDKYRLIISLLGQVSSEAQENIYGYDILLRQALANHISVQPVLAQSCVKDQVLARFAVLADLVMGSGSTKLIKYCPLIEQQFMGTPKALEILDEHFGDVKVKTIEKVLYESYSDASSPLDIVYLEKRLLETFVDTVKCAAARQVFLASQSNDIDNLVIDSGNYGAGMRRHLFFEKPELCSRLNQLDLLMQVVKQALEKAKTDKKNGSLAAATKLYDACSAEKNLNARGLLIVDYLETAYGRLEKGCFKRWLLEHLVQARNLGDIQQLELEPYVYCKNLCVRMRNEYQPAVELVAAADTRAPSNAAKYPSFIRWGISLFSSKRGEISQPEKNDGAENNCSDIDSDEYVSSLLHFSSNKSEDGL